MKKVKYIIRKNPYIIYLSDLSENIEDKDALNKLYDIENEWLFQEEMRETNSYNDIEKFINNPNNINSNYNSKLYVYIGHMKKDIKYKPKYPPKYNENYIQSKLLLYLIGNGFDALSEIRTAHGIPDITVYKNKSPIAIIEVKATGKINNSSVKPYYKKINLPIILCDNINQFPLILKYLKTL